MCVYVYYEKKEVGEKKKVVFIPIISIKKKSLLYHLYLMIYSLYTWVEVAIVEYNCMLSELGFEVWLHSDTNIHNLSRGGYSNLKNVQLARWKGQMGAITLVLIGGSKGLFRGLSPRGPGMKFGYKYGNIYPCIQQLYPYMPYYRTL